MKIWKAELVLFYTEDEDYDTKFIFEQQEKDYKVNEYNNKEWTYYKDWVMDRIPMNMTIERYYDNYKIIQGFDYELNEEELAKLECEMRKVMEKQLRYDQVMYLEKFEKKLKVIKSL